jgi:hypothetical protein
LLKYPEVPPKPASIAGGCNSWRIPGEAMRSHRSLLVQGERCADNLSPHGSERSEWTQGPTSQRVTRTAATWHRSFGPIYRCLIPAAETGRIGWAEFGPKGPIPVFSPFPFFPFLFYFNFFHMFKFLFQISTIQLKF